MSTRASSHNSAQHPPGRKARSAASQPISLSERAELLARARLFASLTPSRLRSIAGAFTERLYAKGETLFHEGDAAHEFFVVARGELAVVTEGTEPHLVNRLGPGEHLGEIALLTGSPRTATVSAVRPSRLLVLAAEDFHKLIESNATVLAHIARALSRQLDARTRQQPARLTTLVVAVTGDPGVSGKTLVAHALAALLAREAHCEALLVRLDPTSVNAGHALNQLLAEPDSAAGRATPTGLPGLAQLHAAMPSSPDPQPTHVCEELIDALALRFPVIVLDVGPAGGAGADFARELSDATVRLVAGGGASPAAARDGVFRVRNLHDGGPRPPINRCEPFVLPKIAASHGQGHVDHVDRVARILRDSDCPATPPLERLARKILGSVVGVALGGGAAFGIAHIGVLKVLRERGIPIDVISGTSFGSIIAALYAAGRSPEEMIDIARQAGRTRTALSALDLSLSGSGLFGGGRLRAVLRNIGLTGDFADLVRPCQVVATDIESGECIRIGTGPLADACRASCSVPVLWAPARRDGRMLVDGGIVDPVPVQALRALGADICIGVSVVPTLKKGVSPTLSQLSRFVASFNPLAYATGTRGMPSAVDIGMNSLHLMQYELGLYQSQAADAHINVDASDFAWTSFNRALELVARGAQAAEQAIPQIEHMFADRQVLAR